MLDRGELRRGIRVVARWIDSRKLNTGSLHILSYMRAFPYPGNFCSALNTATDSFYFSQVVREIDSERNFGN